MVAALKCIEMDTKPINRSVCISELFVRNDLNLIGFDKHVHFMLFT